MVRPLRIEYPNALYHVTTRGNEKKAIFKKARDRELFLNTLADVNKRYNWICHAYCLMNNHYHLLVETPDGNLSVGMRQLNGVYTQHFNKQYRRSGHLFQGRYKAILIQKDSHLLEVCRYVVLNPVRAQIVNNPEEWESSSYRATAGFEKPHGCLSPAWILSLFGSSMSINAKRYRRFVMEGIGKDSIWMDVKGQSFLGSEDFVDGFIDQLKNHRRTGEFSRSQRFLDRPSLEALFSEQVQKDKNTRNHVIRKAIYEFGYKQKEIADFLGIHYTSVSRLISLMLKLKT